MTKEVLGAALLKILEKYTWEKLFAKGWSGEDLLDGQTYVCFIRFFQAELDTPHEARHIIMALQQLFVSRLTPSVSKDKIQSIFASMNPRDQNYRFRENCDCETCVSPRKTLSRLMKQGPAN